MELDVLFFFFLKEVSLTCIVTRKELLPISLKQKKQVVQWVQIKYLYIC